MSKAYPIPEQWYPVIPPEINRDLFLEVRSNPKQEKTRQFILYAFQQYDLQPLKYSPYETLILPKLYLEKVSFKDLVTLPSKIFGEYVKIADKIHQGLEWAQRIHNGESWKSLCNKPDPCPYQRVLFTDNSDLIFNSYPVPNKNDIPRHERHVVGGSTQLNILLPTTHIKRLPVLYDASYHNLTPLCVRYIG